MIIDAASIAALFLDQLAQVPVVVQCVLPPKVDPGLKQWIQPILNLVSIVAVIGIAIWSFGATSRKEHRRWILDQKKAEWKELLSFLHNVGEDCLPPHKNGDTADELIGRLHSAHRRLDGLELQFVLIGRSLDEMQIDGLVQLLGDGGATLEAARISRRSETRLPEEYNRVREVFYNLARALRARADLDLGLTRGGIIIPFEVK